MSMTDAASLKIDERRAFYETDVGKLFRRFENISAAYWQADGASVSEKRMKELDAAEDAARDELIKAFDVTLRRANEAEDSLRRSSLHAKDMFAALRAILRWASQKCPMENDDPKPCPLCGASIDNLQACKAADQTLPLHLLEDIRRVLA